jgi:hypothetical protein
MATCWLLLCRYDLAESSFAQMFNYIEIFTT